MKKNEKKREKGWDSVKRGDYEGFYCKSLKTYKFSAPRSGRDRFAFFGSFWGLDGFVSDMLSVGFALIVIKIVAAFDDFACEKCAQICENLVWRSALEICCGDLPWRFALEICAGDLVWRSALEICSGDLLWRSGLEIWSGDLCWRSGLEICSGCHGVGPNGPQWPSDIFARMWYGSVSAGAAARGLAGRSPRKHVRANTSQGMGFEGGVEG